MTIATLSTLTPILRRALLALPLLLGASPGSAADAQPPRPVVVISDLHFGLGCSEDGCSPYEDFRWTADLKSFLAAIDAWGGGRTDLVIAGDLLELWQRPEEISCEPKPDHPDFGCSVPEIEKLVRHVVSRHAEDLEALGAFAELNDNRLFVVPGNHDAGLLEGSAWTFVEGALKARPTRTRLVTGGTWVADDRRIAVEHGQQIGRDVNRFPDWPQVTELYRGEERLIRTWGEKFVQDLYNGVEASFPLIDNIQPVTAGIRLYRAERGLGGTTRDVARFLAFNLFGTSLTQKISLGAEKGGEPCWEAEPARSRGARLLADALGADDPFRRALLAPATPDDRELVAEVDRLIGDPVAYPEDEILALCDEIALRVAEEKADARTIDPARQTCSPCSGTLGLSIASKVIPETRVLRRYLRALRRQHGDVRLFVYGHTHEARKPWTIDVDDSSAQETKVTLANTGAFQRLVDNDGIERLAKDSGTTVEAIFSDFPLERLPPCYSAVLIRFDTDPPTVETKNWYVDPNSGEGSFEDLCHDECGYRNPKSCDVSDPTG